MALAGSTPRSQVRKLVDGCGQLSEGIGLLGCGYALRLIPLQDGFIDALHVCVHVFEGLFLPY